MENFSTCKSLNAMKHTITGKFIYWKYAVEEEFSKLKCV